MRRRQEKLNNATEDDSVDPQQQEKQQTEDPAVASSIPESTAYWSKEPYAWSTSLDYTPPLLTSSHCAYALYNLFHNTYFDDTVDPYIPNFLLAVVAESSSHPSGLNALYAQPYLYAGSGLGSIDECPLQTCLAGGRQTDSLTFAAVCIVPQCSAYDLAAEDFVSVAERQLDFAIEATTPQETIDLGREFVQTLDRIAQINKFLGTGWTCGNFIVPWSSIGPPFVIFSVLLLVLAGIGTTLARRQRRRREGLTLDEKCETFSTVDVEEEDATSALLPTTMNRSSPSASEVSSQGEHHQHYLNRGTRTTTVSPFWSAFDVSNHLEKLTSSQHSGTACLDGLRVGSILWIMLGHVMAIQSSSGAGYSNPANFLPPTGLTTTFLGQLLFSSRLAVDSFLAISGFLVVHVLLQKFSPSIQQEQQQQSFGRAVILRYLQNLPSLIVTRAVRILPLYAMCLGFYTQIAPHLGSGPFWHQWIALLKPCHDAIWTNFLFVNNFVPFDTPTTDTCFYHSWYLAVDMQLFVFAPLLVFWFQYRARHGLLVTVALFGLSVIITSYLAYYRQWSVNTFDGAAVGRYDMEAYAKPHVRAQAYLAGMFAAMSLQTSGRRDDDQNARYGWKHRCVMAVALLVMGIVTFGTVTGAYARRPCTYKEDPFRNECGSLWSSTTTFLYTAFSRTLWSICIAILMYLCLGTPRAYNNLVALILSLKCWAPLSHLSFGAYLIHPIVIFVWQLGDREKQGFRLLTFGMDYLSVCVISYVAALLAAVTVEFPCATLWKNFVASRRRRRQSGAIDVQVAQQLASRDVVVLQSKTSSFSSFSTTDYGATTNIAQDRTRL